MEIKTINGNNETNDISVLGFWIDKEIIHYLPRNIDNFFPALTAFGLKDTGLTELSKLDMKQFPELIRASFYGSQLDFLESDVFIYNTKLKSLTLIDNDLFIIGHDVFEPLTQLSYVQIEIKCVHKTCKDEGVCLQNLRSDFRENCESDTSIYREIKRLEKELRASRAREIELLQACPLADVATKVEKIFNRIGISEKFKTYLNRFN